MKIFRTEDDYRKYLEAFPNSGGLIISPFYLEGFPKVMWYVSINQEGCENDGIFYTLEAACLYAIAWINSDVFDIDYDDIEYVGD